MAYKSTDLTGGMSDALSNIYNTLNANEQSRLDKERLAKADERLALQDARQARMDLLATPGTEEYKAAQLAKANIELDVNKLDPNYAMKQRAYKAGIVGTPEWLEAKEAEQEYQAQLNKNDPLYQEKLAEIERNKAKFGWLKNQNTTKGNLGAALGRLNQIKLTSEGAPDLTQYNAEKDKLGTIVAVHKKILDRYEGQDIEKLPEAQKAYVINSANIYKDAQNKINSLEIPKGKPVQMKKEDYLKYVQDVGKGLGNPENITKFNAEVKKKLDLLYPTTKNGFTAKQVYDINNEKEKEFSDMRTAHQLLVDTVGKTYAEKYLKENPKVNAAAITNYAKLKKDKKYSKTSITDAISGIVVDGDTDSNRNISSNKADLEKILKDKFKGNKADMVQTIKGYYDVQGTGTFKNWGNNSPIGDALDNFISAYKK